MADNVAVTAGAGTAIAADEVADATLGSCKVQYVKIMDGTLDGTTKAAVGANGLAVDVKALPADFVVIKTFVAKTVDFSAGQTAQTIWDPTGGTKFVITDMVISASAAGAITVFDETDNTTLRVCKLNLAANGGAVVNYRKPYISATADNILKYTTGAGIAGSITVSGYEV